MRPRMIWRVARKEILSTVRDTRAIVSNLLIPLLIMPVVMLGMPLLLGGLFERTATNLTPVGVVGLGNLPTEFIELLESQNVELVPVDDGVEAVQAGDVDVAIRADEPLLSAMANGGTGELLVYSKQGNMKSELEASKVQQAVAVYQQQVVATRLVDAGLDPSVLQPLQVQAVDASTAAERSSGQFSWLIPFFIAIWTLTGGQMTAVDATAGEKERGTLEVLLVAPVKRTEIVVGKFLATLTFGLSAALAAIVGFLIGGVALNAIFLPRLGEEGAEMVAMFGGSLNIDALSVVILVVSALLLAALVAAVLIGITLFARSFKEAQSYIAPLSFVFIIPVVLLQFKDLIGLGDQAYLIPVFNVLLLMDDVVRGVVEPQRLALVWGSMIVMIGLLLAFAHRNFQREEVIFRS